MLMRAASHVAGIRRVALLDFDVHHGNGTQACVGGTVPSLATYAFQTPLSSGSQVFPLYKPWRDFDDAENILFARFSILSAAACASASLVLAIPHARLCCLHAYDRSCCRRLPWRLPAGGEDDGACRRDCMPWEAVGCGAAG